ncbi:hypothetical protein DXC99_00665 [Collinsella sp. TF10-11AT]|nr:hypothetical protein DXC99_00665 [Collinsella sp. TF10-11AT]
MRTLFSSIDVLALPFSLRGRLRTGVCPVLFGQRRQPPSSDAGSIVIAFLDSYEVRFRVRRRTRGADGRRHLRRNKRK